MKVLCLLSAILATIASGDWDGYLANPLVKTNVSYEGLLDCSMDDIFNLALGTNAQNTTSIYALNLTNVGDSVTFSTCWDNVTMSSSDFGGVDLEYDTGLSVWEVNAGQVPEDDVVATLVAENNDAGLLVFCSELTIDTSEFDPNFCYLIQIGSTSDSQNEGGEYGLSMNCTGGYSIEDSCEANYTEPTSTEIELEEDSTSPEPEPSMPEEDPSTTEYMSQEGSTTDSGDMPPGDEADSAYTRVISFAMIAISLLMTVWL